MELLSCINGAGVICETARLIFDSLSPNTRRAYRAQISDVARWHGNTKPTDETMADYIIARFDEGTSPATLRLALSSVNWLAKASEVKSPVGRRTKAVMKMLAEKGHGRGRGQAKPLYYDDAVRILKVARKIDAAIVALLFMAGLRRSEVAALRWGDIVETGTGGLLIHVTMSKNNRDGCINDIRFLKGSFADAVRDIRPEDAEPALLIFGCCPETINNRLKHAARAAGIKNVSAHSGRIGLASELTSRGASMTEVMLAGAWKTPRMVAHYSTGAMAQRGAVNKYF